MRKILFLFIVGALASPNVAMAQVSNWDVANANQDWVQKELGIFRNHETTVTVNANGKVEKKVIDVYTILKAAANDLAVLQVNYSKDIKVKSISATVYDAKGKVIRSNKKSDIQDYSDFNSFSIFEDNRVKVLNMKEFRYPYTVQFEYEVEYPNLYYLPNWYPQPYKKLPVEKASISYLYPEGTNIRFFSKTIPYDVKEELSPSTGLKRKRWEIRDLEVFEEEPMQASEENQFPFLLAAASTFSFNGYKGDLSTWESMGQWFYQLNQGRDALPEETKNKVRELVKDANTDEEKVRILYEFLQNKTRYVSIQLGIGGLQPFEASVVDKNSYGDCKALSNYMYAILKEVGIKSHYALIYGGRNPRTLYPEFPNDYFNHVILNVPLAQDTIWLECTDQTNPFGYLGDFTSDRYALLVTEDGGRLVRTPTYQQQENRQFQQAQFHIDEAGLSRGKLHLQRTGLQTDLGGLLRTMESTTDDKKKWIAENISLPSFDILDFQFKTEKDRIPTVVLDCEIESKSMISKTGNRLFIVPNQLNQLSFNPAKTKKERKYAFERKMAYHDSDSITFAFPANYFVEFNPEPIAFESEFGSYSASFHTQEGELVYVRELKMNSGVFEAEKYEAYKDFMKQIEKADKTRIVLNKKT